MPPQGDQCVFCQLIANPSQLKLVGQTDNFYAWLDINPRARGYTMVVPKEHKGSIEDFSASEYQEAMNLTRKVVDKAKKGLDADGVSVTMNMGEAAGQMVPHAYIQVFPRFKGKESAGTPTGAIFQPDEEAKKNLDSIAKKMADVDSSFGQKTKEAHPDSQNFKDKKDGKESSKKKGSKSKQKSKSKGKDDAIGKIADQVEKGGPLNLGDMSGSSKKSSRKKKSKGEKSGNKSSGHDKEVQASEEEEKEEVRIDEDFEGRSFDWQ